MPDTPVAEAHSESVNARLAAYLSGQKEAIVNELVNRLRNSDAIRTHSLTTYQLRNHTPRILEDILSQLRHYGSETAAKQTGQDAAAHGAARWSQGFDLPELLRECSHLRAIFIYHLRVFEESHPDFGFTERYFAAATLHGVLDEMLIEAAQQFVLLKKAGEIQ